MPALVLIAESDPFNLRLLQEICEAAGHTVLTAMDRSAVLDAVSRKRPDLVVVDVALPGIEPLEEPSTSSDAWRVDRLSGSTIERRAHALGEAALGLGEIDAQRSGGLEILRLLKSDRSFASIPVLLTASDRDESIRRRGIELGAEDCLARPYRVFEIHQRVRSTLRRALLDRLRHDDLFEEALARAGSAAQLPITLEYEMTRAIRFEHALSCVTLSCANLEHLRDAGGDDVAERVMTLLVENVRQCVRTIDHVFRATEHELVLVLPETSASEAEVVVHRLEQRARSGELAPVDHGGGALRGGARFLVGVAGRTEGEHACGLALLAGARRALRPLAAPEE